jgi:hypothetical protein
VEVATSTRARSDNRISRVVVAAQNRTLLFLAVVINVSNRKFGIYQYQLSWLIFIGLVVMISACQEYHLVKRGRPGFDSLMESFLFV